MALTAPGALRDTTLCPTSLRDPRRMPGALAPPSVPTDLLPVPTRRDREPRGTWPPAPGLSPSTSSRVTHAAERGGSPPCPGCVMLWPRPTHNRGAFGWFLPPGHCGQSLHTHSRASFCVDPSLPFSGVELLGHTVIPCLIFWRPSQLFLTKAAVFSIPAGIVQELLFLHVPANTHCFLFLTGTRHSHPSGCAAAARGGSDLHFLKTTDAADRHGPAGRLCIFLQKHLF